MNAITQSRRAASRGGTRGQTRGFTLIELLIAVAIAAILAAVAYPSYTNHVKKARRSDARSLLMEAAARQEQYFLDNRSYTASMTAMGYPANPAPTENGYYSVQVVGATASCPITRCFVLRATPLGSQAGDGYMEINSNGTHFWDKNNNNSIDTGEDNWN